MRLLGEVLDRCLAAAPANKVYKPLRNMRVVGQKLETLAFHFATTLADNASHIEFEIDPRVVTGKIAHATDRAGWCHAVCYEFRSPNFLISPLRSVRSAHSN
jgi:hypothetical protein